MFPYNWGTYGIPPILFHNGIESNSPFEALSKRNQGFHDDLPDEVKESIEQHRSEFREETDVKNLVEKLEMTK